jgi:VIT1/CCC1 family predicted Fe2+/Mn2+ transporter
MFNDNVKLDMTKPLSIKENLKKSILVTSGSSLIGAFLFFVAWLINPNAWFLSLSIILAVSGIAYYFIIKAVERKYLPDIEMHDKGFN